MAQRSQQKHVTYYDILEISPTARDEEVKQAYRRLAMLWHPDRNRGNARAAEFKLKSINEAYAHLRDRAMRARYDQMLQRQYHKLAAQNDNVAQTQGLLGQFWSWFFAYDKDSGIK